MPNSGLKLHGKNAAIYYAQPGGAKGGVATKAEWTVNMSRDYVDATVFGDKNKTYLVGLPDIQGTFSGILDVSGDVMVNSTFGQASTTTSDTVWLYLYADDQSASKILLAHGPALVDSSINASNTDAIRVTGNFRATTWGTGTSATSWTFFTNGTLPNA